MIRLSQVRQNLNDAAVSPEMLAARALKLRTEDIVSVRVFKKSVDARDKRDVHFSLTLDVELRRMPAMLPKNAQLIENEAPKVSRQAFLRAANSRNPDSANSCSKTVPHAAAQSAQRPIVVGMGPAGLFAALRLAQVGLCPLVVERGKPVDARAQDVEAFWRGGAFNPESNVQFGEGGAGTFSDGKLNSGIKDPRCREVLETFARMGAPEEILWEAKPHIGTDRLRTVVRNLREEIIALGGEVRFETKLDGLLVEDNRLAAVKLNGVEMPAQQLILAVGHSARDSFQMLLDAGAAMQQKPFSIGARIEHRQINVNRAQYGAAAEHPALGAADYKLSCHLPDGRAAYTFCMCPGGRVVAAASEEGGVVVNGMSLFARDGENANSALLVSVQPGDYGGDDPLAGVRFQQKWERAAFAQGGGDYRAPAQRVGDFMSDRASSGAGAVRPSYEPGVRWGRVDDCLPDYVVRDMKAAIVQFDRKLRGFADADAVLTGVETRSSSPVRILRGENCCALGIAGLYPAGEGAGYAGGILSAAVDGLRCAEALMTNCGVKV